MSIGRLSFIIVAFLLMTGCAAGHRIDYQQAIPVVSVATENTVSVLVVDERPYVTSHRKGADYVGNSRALYYNPFRVTTASRNPLASDLQVAIINGLKRNGVNAKHRSEKGAAADNVGQRFLLVTIREWKIDVYMRVRFDYDITASVQDENGNVLGSSQTKGSSQISNFFIAGGDVLKSAIDDPGVKTALAGQTARRATGQAPATNIKQSNSAYDNCMARVIRISDRALRLKAMAACDSSQ